MIACDCLRKLLISILVYSMYPKVLIWEYQNIPRKSLPDLKLLNYFYISQPKHLLWIIIMTTITKC